MGTRGAFIVIGAAILAVVALGRWSDDTHGETFVLKLHEPGHEVGRDAAIGHYNSSRYEPGTGYTFAVPLQHLSAARKYPTPQEKVGEMFIVCIAGEPTLESGKPLEGQCTGTVILGEGTLALSMGGEIGRKVAGTITGGTGKYAGASGTFTWNGLYEKTDIYHVTLP